jgi:hypothetical protein
MHIDIYIHTYLHVHIGNVNEERETNRFISRDRSLLIDLTNVNDLEKNCPYQAGIYMYIYVYTYVPVYFCVYVCMHTCI